MLRPPEPQTPLASVAGSSPLSGSRQPCCYITRQGEETESIQLRQGNRWDPNVATWTSRRGCLLQHQWAEIQPSSEDSDGYSHAVRLGTPRPHHFAEVSLNNSWNQTIHPDVLGSQLQRQCPSETQQGCFADIVGTQLLEENYKCLGWRQKKVSAGFLTHRGSQLNKLRAQTHSAQPC